MRVLVTGADGFVGSRLTSRLLSDGHCVTAAVLPNAPVVERNALALRASGVPIVDFDLLDKESVTKAVGGGYDAVVHLAGVSSGSEAGRDPLSAWYVNTLGTALLVNAIVNGDAAARLLHVSSGEVYGHGEPMPRAEGSDTSPCSTYAATKLASEIAALEAGRRTDLEVIIARPFPHTGAGQDGRFVVPAFAKRVVDAKRHGVDEIKVGNLDPVRDYLHVEDAVNAYALLLEAGCSGEVYNVSSGSGVSVSDLLAMITAAAGHSVNPVVDETLARTVDVPHLVGNSEKLSEATGWVPNHSLEQAVREVVDAQAF